MLAPLQDYLYPKDPMSSLLLHATKDYYFHQLSVGVNSQEPSPRELQWIVLGDMNIEHLFNIFTYIDAGSKKLWDACANFMYHLYWHKPRLFTLLGQKIEGLPDNHPSKPHCLFYLY